MTNYYIVEMIKQIKSNIEQFNGTNSEGNRITFTATYDSEATLNVIFTDKFTQPESFGKK